MRATKRNLNNFIERVEELDQPLTQKQRNRLNFLMNSRRFIYAYEYGGTVAVALATRETEHLSKLNLDGTLEFICELSHDPC